MLTLAIIALVLCAGAAATLVGAHLIARAHPPRGRFIAVGPWRQHVVELGEARAGEPPLVLLHGAGCNLEDMRLALGDALAATHRVVLVDRPGQGWSERPDDGHSPSAQAAVLRGVLDALGIDRAILVGHSWGGALALTFALEHSARVAGLVLLAPPTHPHLRRLTRLYRVLGAPFAGPLFAYTLALPLAAAAFDSGLREAFLPQTPPHDYRRRSAAFLLLRPKAFLANARDIAGLRAFLEDEAPRYGSLAAPTIIIAGDRDRVVPARLHAALLPAAVPGVKLTILPGVGHMPHHAAPERVIAAVDEVAAAVATGGRA